MPLLQGQNSEAQQPTMQDAERYIFSNIENTKNFNLEQNALSFQTTKYVTFEQFAADLKGGIGIVHGAVGLDFIERIGVRYLDAVMPKPDETLSEYLNPGVMGLYEKLKGNIQYSFSETLTHGENSSVLSRTILQNGKIGFPPDILTGMTLTVQQPFHQFDGMHAVIDTDAFYGERTRFDLEELIKTLDALHECTSASFKATITDHARKTWE